MTGLTREVDARTLHFGPIGLGGPMPPEKSRELLEAETAWMVLGERVPDSVCNQFKDLVSAYRDGLFRYKTFTDLDRDSYRVLEVALKARFLEHYDRRLPLAKDREERNVEVSDFEGARRLVVSSGGWRLNGHRRFNGSFASLLHWARAEGYFFGQFNRVREDVTPQIRNHVLHSEYDRLIAPPDALRRLSVLYQWVQRLWGYDTPGGDAYPGRVPRFLWIVGHGTGRCTWMRIEYPLSEVKEYREHKTWYVVLAVERAELGDWRPGFECTAMPVDIVWGPGGWEILVDVVERNSTLWTIDSVDVLDRTFFIRILPGGVELARNGKQVRELKDRRPEERWTVIRADSPSAAMHHLSGYTPGDHAADGVCHACAVEVVMHGARRETIDRCLKPKP
jgi:hypothetical protein